MIRVTSRWVANPEMITELSVKLRQVNMGNVCLFLTLTNVTSFASLVSRVVGLFAFLSGRKQTNYAIDKRRERLRKWKGSSKQLSH